MSLVGVNCVLGDVPMERHKQCMLEKRPCGIPATILEAMTRPNIERMTLEEEGRIFSPSSIDACHRKYHLTKHYQYYLNVEDAWSVTRGTLMHDSMRHLPAPDGTLGVIRELRLVHAVDTKHGLQEFTGQIDEILLLGIEDGVLHCTITDWKTKADVPHTLIEADRLHVYQVNFYRFLVENALANYLLPGAKGSLIGANNSAKLYLNEVIPEFTSVVVDELVVCYLAGNKVRTFSTNHVAVVRGKRLGYRDEYNKWHPTQPAEYEEVTLKAIQMFAPEYTRGLIVKGIEDQMESDVELAPPLQDERAPIMCPRCPVKQVCVDIGIHIEGRKMEEQLRYLGGNE